MSLKLDKHQLLAINKLRTGSILNGGVGSGKSRTAIAYYYLKIANGQLEINGHGEYKIMQRPTNLYIITTARKRDTLEWEEELAPFGLTTNSKLNPGSITIVIDSWNNIKKYVDIKKSFFIFDEQRVVGSGAWVKSFLKIAKNNPWILLSATPGDTWLDYIPVFIANGFYKNRTEFLRRHVVYNQFVKFPKVDRYIETGHLLKLRSKILVDMKYKKHTNQIHKEIRVKYNQKDYNRILKDRWNIFKDKPIKNITELCYSLRQVINSDATRVKAMEQLTKKHNKLIVFYNFNYELYILRDIGKRLKIPTTEWNGHKHEPIPKTDKWLYLVQYTSNAEGWNCIETNAMVFYSQNYSYKIKIQASGRIDRRNTPFEDLYYYTFISPASMDIAIKKALDDKKNFNENKFIED